MSGATVALWLLSTAASAQQSLPSAGLQSNLPSAPLQMNLPSASLPLETAVAAPRTDLFRAGPDTYAPRFDHPPQFDPRLVPCCAGFVGPWFGATVPWASDAMSRQVRKAPRVGYLQLLVQPARAHVYVDGFYKGTVSDIGRLLPIEAGPRRIELRAPGYETVTFDVKIVPDETITYEADLERVPREKPIAAVPAVPKTFYVIPNCYAGDKPPAQVVLPRTCDPATVRTIPPVVNAMTRK
jgi:hypothetical protein